MKVWYKSKLLTQSIDNDYLYHYRDIREWKGK